MTEAITVKLKDTWPEAGLKYGWQNGFEGFCLDYSLLTIASMAEKHIEFVVKGRKQRYRIAPEQAIEVVRQFSSVFTRKKDRKPVAVVPSSACERIYGTN